VKTSTTALPFAIAPRAWMRKAATAVAALACLGSAQASWQVDTTNASTVELTFLAWDNNGISPKLVFVKDLGITMATFFTSAQVDTGTQMSWYLGGADDPTWDTFLNTDVSTGVKPDVSKIRWSVFAEAQPGGASPEPGAYKLYTTNLQGLSGNPSTILGLGTLSGDFLINTATSIEAFYGGNKNTGTLGSAVDGSALIKATDGPSKFPFDPGMLMGAGNQITFGNQIGRGTGNLVGQSSWFYALTGSDLFDSSLPVTIDEFDNLTNDGYWGLAAASAADKAGQYFLSYNLNGTMTALEARSGILASNNFARLAGVLSLSSSAGKSQTVLNMTESFLRGFSKVAASLPRAADGDLSQTLASDGTLELPSPSAVPESGSAALMGAGLAVLAGLQLRRRRASARG
jgi:hypothetical protein